MMYAQVAHIGAGDHWPGNLWLGKKDLSNNAVQHKLNIGRTRCIFHNGSRCDGPWWRCPILLERGSKITPPANYQKGSGGGGGRSGGGGGRGNGGRGGRGDGHGGHGGGKAQSDSTGSGSLEAGATCRAGAEAEPLAPPPSSASHVSGGDVSGPVLPSTALIPPVNGNAAGGVTVTGQACRAQELAESNEPPPLQSPVPLSSSDGCSFKEEDLDFTFAWDENVCVGWCAWLVLCRQFLSSRSGRVSSIAVLRGTQTERRRVQIAACRTTCLRMKIFFLLT